MKKAFLTAVPALALLLAGPAMAAFADADADGNGALSADEFTAAFPDATAEVFTAVDTNADGGITEDEHLAAVEAGLLPAD